MALDEQFRDVLGITDLAVARRAIADFTGDSGGRFRDLALTIGGRPLSFIDDNTHLQVTGARRNIVSPPKAQDASAAGIMYRNHSGQIYKKLVINTRNEETLKGFFLEVYIALVLRSINPHICRPIHVFRNDAIRRNARETTENVRVKYGSSSQEEALFIFMDTIPHNIQAHCQRRLQAGDSAITITLNIIAQLSTILQNLEQVAFFHNDLHTGNVLFTEGGELVIIDFGRSSVRVGGGGGGGGTIYGEPDDRIGPRRPMPCDLAIFLTNFHSIMRDPTSRAFIHSLYDTPHGNLFDYTYALAERNRRNPRIVVHHHYLYYPWVIFEDALYRFPEGTWNPEHVADFEACPTLKPAGALAAATAPDAAARAAARAAAAAAAAPPSAAARAAAAEAAALLPRPRSAPGCCSRGATTGCVICGGGKKRKTRTRRNKKHATLRKKRGTLFKKH